MKGNANAVALPDTSGRSMPGADRKAPSLDTLDSLVLLRDVRDYLLEAHPYSDDAPGHSHDRPGRWDADGSPCAWCATWKRVQACLEQNAQISGGIPSAESDCYAKHKETNNDRT